MLKWTKIWYLQSNFGMSINTISNEISNNTKYIYRSTAAAKLRQWKKPSLAQELNNQLSERLQTRQDSNETEKSLTSEITPLYFCPVNAYSVIDVFFLLTIVRTRFKFQQIYFSCLLLQPPEQ